MFEINTGLFLSLGCSFHVFTCVDVYPFFWDSVGASYTLKIRINSKIRMNLVIYIVYAQHIPGIYRKNMKHAIAPVNMIVWI